MGRLKVENINDRVSVCLGGNCGRRAISSTSDFFRDADYYSHKEDEESFTIIKHRLIVPAHAHKASKRVRKSGLGTCVQFESQIPLGQFFYDKEESDEDVLKFYFNQQNKNN